MAELITNRDKSEYRIKAT